MSDPQLPPVPPTPPAGDASNPPQAPFPSAPPAASALPADPQYPAAPPYGTPQPPFGQQAPQQAPYAQQPAAPQHQQPAQPAQQGYGQPQAQPSGQQTPQYPGASAPYGGYTQPSYGSAATRVGPAGSTNTLARAAFIIALAVAAIGALQVLIQPFLISSIGYYGGYGAVTLLFGIFSFLASAAALVLGLIAVRRPGGQVFAGIAIGVGAVQLLGVVLGWISSLFYGFL